RVGPHLLGRRLVVVAVEGAQEVAPVPAVEGEHARYPAQGPQREPQTVAVAEPAGRQPGIRLDHIGRDERVLQVEGGEVAIGREDGSTSALGPGGSAPASWRRANTGLGDDRRQVD